MSWYTDKNVSFRRIKERIEPTVKSLVRKGTIVFYEVPVKSDNHFTVDIIRYTMQCVYSGEILFPCSFNTDITKSSKKNTSLKVFFDRVFNKSFRRNVTDRLATAFMDTCKSPFLFKALGGFCESGDFNCLKVSFLNGETFLVTTKDVKEGEVLVSSPMDIKVPLPTDDFERQFEAIDQTLVDDIQWYNMALGSRGDALQVRPDCRVRVVNADIDKKLEDVIKKYGIEREMGFTDIQERIVEMEKEGPEEDEEGMLKMMEDKYNELMGEHFGWEFV